MKTNLSTHQRFKNVLSHFGYAENGSASDGECSQNTVLRHTVNGHAQ